MPRFIQSNIAKALALIGLAASSGASFALTVYTAGPEGLIKDLAAGFEAESGIKVDYFQGTTGKVMARLEAEAANPHADVVISASWDSAVDLEQRGWLLNYQSPNAASVPAAYKAPGYVAQGLSALAIAWNPASGTPRPADWGDLASPAFAGKVNMPDPSQSGTALELLSGLEAAHGAQAWRLFGELKANGMNIAGANAQALNPVLQGAKAAVFGAVDYITYGAQSKGEKIEIIFPSSGTVVAARPMMILKGSRQQDEARRFVDYVLSEQGQQLVAKTFLIPARTDVAAQRPPLAEIQALPTADEAERAGRDALLKRFSELFLRK
ncbi:extracellular solute-binding protein [Corticibacter populi]|uniref:Extracellular solute-binding protein n=1 Tax=Corticibacter populi TaxID=1550736 RepID=A0A3M6R0W6_9BURK|nr:ABC transporter substrate-binding protein [Corticibacter populi]RMX08897.1 extracellular solute-binding protein [Corticibacter populi]RZS35738.1 iron(III) transport system substrate-binding protein [Corticibacter populi]